MVSRKRLRVLIVSSFLLPLFAVAPVLAQTETTTDDTTTTRKTLEERLAERKAALQTRLTAAQQTRLRGRCRAAQVILASYQERLTRLETNRTTAHDRIISKLNDIVAKVGDQADTTALKASIETLKTKTAAFAASLDTYQEAVADLAEMDCVSDPTAFQATLETIRTQRAELAESAADIRSFLTDTVKPQLQALRAALGSDSETE